MDTVTEELPAVPTRIVACKETVRLIGWFVREVYHYGVEHAFARIVCTWQDVMEADRILTLQWVNHVHSV